MKNTLIVTVGTRDVQAPNQKDLHFREPNFQLYENKNISGYKFFANPLREGKLVLADKSLLNAVAYPIIKPAIEYLIREKKFISDLLLICTNQESVEEKYRKNDTVYFAEIIRQLVRRDFKTDQIGEIHPLLEVTKDVTNYGEMYSYFGERLPQILKNPDDHIVYIYPQGGIDAINFPTLLKTIELFPNTFHLCKSEASLDVEPSDFPQRFRAGVEKQKIPVLLDKYYYNEVYSSDSYISALASHAHYRLMSNYNLALKALKSTTVTPFISMLKDTSATLLENDSMHLKNFYLTAKILFQRGDYSSFVLKMNSLVDFFIQRNAQVILQELEVTEFFHLTPTKQIEFKRIFPIIYKEITGKTPPSIPYYDGYLFNLSICSCFNKDYYKRPFINMTLKLKDERNKIAHLPNDSALTEIERIFNKTEQPQPSKNVFDYYFEQGDKFWGVTGYGDYEVINEAIKTRLLTNKTT